MHGVELALTGFWLGSLVFKTYVAPTGAPQRKSWIPALGILACILALIWFVLVASDIAESWTPAVLFSVAWGTRFGLIWMGKIALELLILAMMMTHRWRAAVVLALVLPLASSMTGHPVAMGENGHLLSIALDDFHFTAVGVWSGGLISLWLWLSVCDPLQARAGVLRFSRVAMVSTFVIAVTGIANAVRFGVSPGDPWQTEYGKLVVLKLALFIGVILIASLNQFVHLRNWSENSAPVFVRRVQMTAFAEWIGVVLIFGVAGFLTQSSPPLM